MVTSALSSTPSSVASNPKNNLSFSPTALQDDSFTPQAFVRDHRPHAPLSVLRDDLRTHVASLSAQIVHALQADFHHFITPPPALSDAPTLAAALTPPLHALRNHLESLHATLGTQAAGLREALAAHHQLLSRRAQLAALLAAHDGLAKLERLLAAPPTPDILAAPSLAHLHRVAAETANLSFVVARAPQGPFLRALTPRLNTVRRSARIALDAVLQPALDCLPNDSTPLARVLALYLTAGLPDNALDFFSRTVVAPFATTLRMSPMLSAAETSGSSPATPAHALRSAQRAVTLFLNERVAPVVRLIADTPELAGQLDVVGVAVWPPVQRALAKHMAPAFSPGLPDVFHASFLAGQDLLSDIRSAADPAFRSTLSSASATEDFLRLWNLPVYFQLRFQEIASAFETRLEAGPIVRATNTTASVASAHAAEAHLLRDDVYATDASSALVGALRRCWNPAVFLRALTHRFVRLALQLVARYVTWVRVGLAGAWPEGEGGGAGGADGAARVVRDVATLQLRLPAEMASVLRARLQGRAGKDSDVVADTKDGEEVYADTDIAMIDELEGAFTNAVEALAALAPDLLRAIGDALARTCVANLQPLRGILATYRMSSKQAPSTHSSFVPKILRPLRVFLREHESTLSSEDCVEIATAVAETTSAEYCAMATDLLQRNKSSEATLRRLNIGRGGAGAGTGGAVVEKIAMQLFLDVEKFADEIAAVGVDASRVPSLETLRASVRRERGDVKSEEAAKSEEATPPVSGKPAESVTGVSAVDDEAAKADAPAPS